MDTEELKRRITASINAGASLEAHRQILIKFKRMGGTQKGAYTALLGELEAQRLHNDEWFEDAMLEVLDIVYGFCNQEWWVWDSYYISNPENFADTE